MLAAGPTPVAAAVSRWATDPWSLGAWSSVVAVGGRLPRPHDLRRSLSAPIGPRLRLAGEACHATRPAMAHGAWESGQDAVHALLADQPDVGRLVVIGAGAAGVAAARAAETLGREVIVLEARDRVGGRLHTVDLGDGIAADLGGAWLQQLSVNVLVDEARANARPLVPTRLDRPRVVAAHGGRVADDVVVEVLGAVEAVVTDMAGHGRDLTLATAAAAAQDRLPPPLRPLVGPLVEAAYVLEGGLDPTLASATAAVSEPGIGEGDALVVGGLGALVTALAERLDVRLDHPVRRIDHSSSGVRADVREGTVQADAAIVTVPLDLLRLGHLALDPAPDQAQRDAMAGLRLGVVEKVLLRYADRWWPREPGDTGHVWFLDGRPSWVEWFDLTDVVGAPTLALLSGGPAARSLHGAPVRPDAAVVADAHAVVARYAAAG